MLSQRMRRSGQLAALAVALVLAVCPPTVLAWGPQGHRVIARVAAERLTPEARAAIRDLLHPDDTLPDIADWADHEGHEVYPGSSPWHYANISIQDAHYADGRDAARPDNVVHQIDRYRKILLDHSRPKPERQRALLFFVHFIADVHQPLHIGENRDRGGNQTQVRFEGSGTNLHQLWDSGLIRAIGGSDQVWAGRIERAITPATNRAWSQGSPPAWADESLQAAKLAYHDLAGAPRSIETGYTLGTPYLRQVEPILIEQMARASVRLANELNAVFAEPAATHRR